LVGKPGHDPRLEGSKPSVLTITPFPYIGLGGEI
jgi:hypothetical protein